MIPVIVKDITFANEVMSSSFSSSKGANSVIELYRTWHLSVSLFFFLLSGWICFHGVLD